MQLSPGQRKALEDAIVKAFTRERLDRMLRRELGIYLERELDTRRGFMYLVTDVIDLAIAQGWLDTFLRVTRSEIPGNLALRVAIEAIGIAEIGPPPAQDDPQRLEKLVRQRAPFVKFEEFTQKLLTIGGQICRVENKAGSPLGTGWAVARGMILTNFHVIKQFVDTGSRPVCRFDYDTSDSSVGRLADAADQWLVDYAPYAPSDVANVTAQPTADELDYALLMLAEDVGDDMLESGAKRGWIAVTEAAPVVTKEDIMLIGQHPEGRELELAFGKVLGYNSSGTRLRYDANTEPGSSGAPCFDVALTPFGIHQAGGPGTADAFNQCVPLRMVIDRMKKRNVYPFWTATPPGGQPISP